MDNNRRPHIFAAKALSLTVLALLAPLAGDGTESNVRMWAEELKGAHEVEIPDEFGLVGVSWPSAQPPPAEVEVRTSLDGRSWDQWSELHVPDADEGPDLGVEDRGVRATAPLWVGRGRFVQVRFEGRVPPGAEVNAIDPGPDPAPPGGRPAFALAGQPGIVSRAQWGANEGMRRAGPRYASSVRVGFVHHTATSNSYAAGDSAGIVRSIYAYHVNSNGWDDIGYNFLVDRFGQIFEGRAGGIDRAVIGAHAGGFNSGSTGVAVIGTFDSVGPPQAAVSSVQNLLAWKLDLDHVDPLSRMNVVSGGSNKYPAGTSVNLPAIAGHRDVGHTSCPGTALYNLLPNIRNAVNGIGRPKLYNPSASPTVFTPNGDGVAETVNSSVRPSDAGEWSLTILGPTGSAVRAVTGSGTSLSFNWDGRDAAGQVLPHGWYRFRWDLQTGAGAARTAEARALLGAWPEGSFLKEPHDLAVYRMVGGVLQHAPSEAVFLSHSTWSDIAIVPPGTVAAYRRSGQVRVREGSLVIGPSDPSPVWVVSDGRRRHIRSESDFHRAGYSWGAIRRLPQSDIDAIPTGDPLDASALTHVNGTLVKGEGPAVFWIQHGTRRHVTNEPVFNSWFSWGEIVRISDAELHAYPLGTPLGFRDGAVVHTPDRAVWLISQGNRRHISSEPTFYSLGYGWHSVRWVGQTDVAANPLGPPI